jgi:hypothetical protein
MKMKTIRRGQQARDGFTLDSSPARGPASMNGRYPGLDIMD